MIWRPAKRSDWVLVGIGAALLISVVATLGVFAWRQLPQVVAYDAMRQTFGADFSYDVSLGATSSVSAKGLVMDGAASLDISTGVSATAPSLTASAVRKGDDIYVRSDNLADLYMKHFLGASLFPLSGIIRPVASQASGQWIHMKASDLPAANGDLKTVSCSVDLLWRLRNNPSARQQFTDTYKKQTFLDIERIASDEKSQTLRLTPDHAKMAEFYEQLKKTSFYQELAKCDRGSFPLNDERAKKVYVDMTVDTKTRTVSSLSVRGIEKQDVVAHVRLARVESPAINVPEKYIEYKDLGTSVFGSLLGL